MKYPSRRGYLAATGSLLGVISGCSSSSNDTPAGDIIVGPDGRFTFDPEDYRIAQNETVVWSFASSGHNVSCRPNDSSMVELPPDADPFASYAEGESSMTTEDRGSTFSQTFDTTGTYQYVCIPHQGSGMIGTVIVEEA